MKFPPFAQKPTSLAAYAATSKTPSEQFAAALNNSIACASYLVEKLDEITIASSTKREVAALVLYATAIEHHRSINLLLTQPNPAFGSALALGRSIYESHSRGLWIGQVASDKQVEYFLENTQKAPNMKAIIEAIENKLLNSKPSNLRGIYDARWGSLSGYLHGDAQHIQQWGHNGILRPNFDLVEVSRFVKFATRTALTSGSHFAKVAGHEKLALAIQAELPRFDG